MKLKNNIIIILVLLASFVTGITVEASTLNFSVEQELPENQRNSNNFFDLLVSPNQTQILNVKLKNDTDKERVIVVKVDTATSSSNGTVNYGVSNSRLNETLPEKMENILIPEKNEVKLPAKSSIDLALNLKMPSKFFPGILAGGITFQEKNSTADEKEEEKSNLKINNEFAYTIGILLREDEKAISPDLKLGNVRAGQVNYRNKILIDLINTKSTYVNELEFEAIVTKNNDKNTKYSFSNSNLQMAPDSIMEIPMPLDGHKLKSGKYTLDLSLKSREQKWNLKKEFNITTKEAKKFNNQEVTIEDQEGVNWKLLTLIGIGIIVLILLLVFIVINRSRKRKKKEKRKKYSK